MATNVARIQAELDLDNGRFSGKITNSIGQVQKFNSVVNNTSQSIKNIERRVTGFGASVRDAMVVLGQFRASMMTVWAGTGQWVAAIIKANAELERMQALLRGVAKGDQAQRNAQANADLAYTIKLAQEAPFSINAIGDSIVKLRSAGIDATQTMSGLTNAVAAFGGNDETLKRATIALQQMAGKGVVSMEELRQQLGEAVPTAMRLMARGMGVSMGELTKKVSTGTVEAMSAIKAMTLEMDREYEGAGREMMKTWSGMTAKLKTEWMLFAKEIGDAGLFDAAKDGLRELTNILKDQNTINSVKALGQSLGQMISIFMEGAKWIIANQDAIVAWGKAIGTVVVGGYVLSLIRNMNFLQAAMVSMRAHMAKAGVENSNFIKSFAGMGVMGAARTAAVGLGGAISSLAGTLTGFTGPVGVAIAAIGLLIGWMVKLRIEAEQTMSALNRVMNLKANDFASAEDIEKATTKLEQYEKLARRIATQGQRLRGNPEEDRSMLMSVASELNDTKLLQQIKDADAAGVMDLMKSMELNLRKAKVTLQENIDRSNQNLRIFNEKKFVEGNSDVLDRAVGEVADRFRKKEAEFEAAASGKSQEFINEGRNKLLKEGNDAQVKILDQQIAILTEKSKTMSGLDAKYTRDLIEQRKERRRVLQAQTNDILAARAAGIQTITAPGGDKDAAKKAKADADSLATQLENLRGKSAQLKAQIDGETIPSLAKFDELLKAGKWGKNPNQGIVAEIRKVITANADLAAEVKKNKATETLSSNLDEMAAKAKADVVTSSLKESGDVYSKVAAGMVGFNREVAVLRLGLDKTNMSAEEFDKKVKEIKDTLFEVDMNRFTDWVTETNVENNTAILEDRAKTLAEYNEKLRQYGILRANLIAGANGNQDRIDEINKGVDSAIASETKRFNYETRSSWQKWIDEYKDITQEMDDVWGQSMESMSNSLTDALTSGKSGWRDYATAILKEITRIMTAKVIAQFVEFAASFFGGSAGGGGYSKAGMTANTSASSAGSNIKGYANGGIHSAAGSMPLHKYASGGIAKTPQMALFGEGRLPEAYVPLPDGRSIPVTMDGATGGGGVQNNISINVNVQGDGSAETTVDGGSSEDRKLASSLKVAVVKVIQEEMRPGGSIWKANNR